MFGGKLNSFDFFDTVRASQPVTHLVSELILIRGEILADHGDLSKANNSHSVLKKLSHYG